jgi:preflagellin peptidase FlaK
MRPASETPTKIY